MAPSWNAEHSSAEFQQRADSPLESIEDARNYFTANAKRRISNITATSISSFPDSALPSDSEAPLAFHSSAKPRPTFRVGSLRRSPLPDRLSPLRLPRPSPRRPRSREDDAPEPSAPLVLLHVTVLPPRLPWRRSILETSLPEHLKHQLGELRAQSSGLVRQRGILIAHPQDEFDMLVEHVLEALDLVPERIGPDGQFRPRTPTTIVDDEDSDESPRPCHTCQRFHDSDDGAGWHVRVYAANGLMRAGAWAAAWSEMERVDVEVLPCISDDIRRRLDEAQSTQDAEDDDNNEFALQKTEQLRPPLSQPKHDIPVLQHEQPKQHVPTIQHEQPQQHIQDTLPQAYRPKEIPLNILVRNYIYLLLRDRRNLAIVFLVLTLLASTWHGMMRPATGAEAGIFGHGNLHVVGDMLPRSHVMSLEAAVLKIEDDTDDTMPVPTAEAPVPEAENTEDLIPSPDTETCSSHLDHLAPVSPNPSLVLTQLLV